MLPRARIPIIKLSRPPSEALPFGISCDIGFENRLALENTKLLLTYANVDNRLKTMVLFRKPYRFFVRLLNNKAEPACISESMDKEETDQ